MTTKTPPRLSKREYEFEYDQKANITQHPVLENGGVRLVDHMGSDLAVANAARVSFLKESNEISAADERLIRFLVRENHWSPFRHAFITFEVKAPLLTARQWWKYVTGSDHTMDSWNESSRRYVTMEPSFYVPGPNQWRSAPENKKQGSGPAVDELAGSILTTWLEETIETAVERYEQAIASPEVGGFGIAPEQARCLLPAYAMHVVWRWSASLQSVLHFLRERLAHDAQSEIQDYAKAVKAIAEPLFPLSFKAVFDA